MTSSRVFATAAVAAVLGALLVALPGPAAVADAEPSPPASATEISSGVISTGFGADGAWAVALSPSPTAWSTTGDDVLRVPSASETTIPEGSEYAWLGVAGAPMWTTTAYADRASGSTPALLTLATRMGISTRKTELSSSDPDVRISIAGVDGPGDAAIYSVPTSRAEGDPVPDIPSETFRFGTGTQADDTPQGAGPVELAARTSQVAQGWFTAEGLYCLSVRTEATAADESPLSATGVIRIAVGDGVSATAPCGATPEEAPAEDPDDDGSDEEPDDGVRIVRDGHIDVIAPQIDTDENGDLSLALRAHHSTPEYGWMEWDDFILYTDDRAKTTLPAEYTAAANYSFVGEPGSTVWRSPAGQVAGLPWVGLSTESSTLDVLGSDALISVRLDAVTGTDGDDAPGDMVRSRINSAQSGANVDYSTRIGLPSAVLERLGTHVHYNWWFTQPGVYCLAFTVEATMPDGTVQSAREQLTHVVGSQIDPTTVTPCGVTQDYPPYTPKAAAPAADDADQTVVADNGWWSFDTRIVDGELVTNLREQDLYRATPGRNRDVESVILFSPNATQLAGTGRNYNLWGGANPALYWDTTGLSLSEATDGVTWTIDGVDGPGELTTYAGLNGRGLVFDTAAGVTSATLRAQTQTESSSWSVTAPGKYCLTLTWSVPDGAGGTLSTTKTLTAVAGDETVFAHDETTLTQTCADGAEGTDPGDDPAQDPDDPGDAVWDVTNGTVNDAGAVILNDGHVDVASLLEDGQMVTKIKDTTESSTPAWHDTADVVLQLLPDAQTVVPELDDYAFLGDAGDTIWQVTEVQQDGLLWPGWSTEKIAVDATQTGVTWRLDNADGPGDFALFTSSATSLGGADVLFNTRDGITAADSFEIAKNAHVHGTWVFNAEGVYCLDSTRSTTLADGATASHDFTLAIAVGETDVWEVDPTNCAATSPEEPEPEPTVPATPAQPDVAVDDSTLAVSWVAPEDGGSPITGYTVRLFGGAVPLVHNVAADADTVTFADVDAGTYRATVTAVNAVGASAPSEPSAAVTVTTSVSSPEPTDPADPEPERTPEPTDPEPTEPDLPGTGLAPVDDADLTDANRGGVEAPEAAAPGTRVVVTVPGRAGQQVRVWLHSSPVVLGTATVDASSHAVVTIPADAALGEHKIVVQALDGMLVGWDDLRVAIPAETGPDGGHLPATGNTLDAPLVTVIAALLTLAGAAALMVVRRGRRVTESGSLDA